MKGFKELFEKKYKYGSIQIDLNKDIKDKILKFANSIPKEDLYIDTEDNNRGGIEEDSHVTVRYGLDSPAIEELNSVFNGYGESSLRLGKLSIFEADKYDVLKIDVESSNLIDLNKMIGENFDLPGETFKDYKPHATIAYMKKGKADKYVSDETFKNSTNDFFELTFSDRDGNKNKIKL